MSMTLILWKGPVVNDPDAAAALIRPWSDAGDESSWPPPGSSCSERWLQAPWAGCGPKSATDKNFGTLTTATDLSPPTTSARRARVIRTSTSRHLVATPAQLNATALHSADANIG
jgi:hypothetical protein